MSDWGYTSRMEEIKALYAKHCSKGCPKKQGSPCRNQGCSIAQEMKRLYYHETTRANQYADGVVKTVKFNNYPVGKKLY